MKVNCGHLLQLERAKAAVCSMAPAQGVPGDLRPARSQGWMLRSASVQLLGLLPVIFYALGCSFQPRLMKFISFQAEGKWGSQETPG